MKTGPLPKAREWDRSDPYDPPLPKRSLTGVLALIAGVIVMGIGAAVIAISSLQ